MKTKKLILLTAFLMLFSITLAVAQNVRGGCTSINCYYNITGWNDDKDPASSSKTILVDKAVTKFQCGIGANLAKTKTAGATFTINVYKNGSTTPTTTVNETNYGGTNEYAVANPVTVAGDACKVEITVTPSTTLGTGCSTTPWTYTWNISYVTGCISPNPIPYYRISDGTWWVNKATTDTTINLEMAIGNTIMLGINPSTGTIAWTGCNGFTGTTREFSFDPGFTAAGQTCTVTGVYTDICLKSTTYTYNLSVPLVCTPVAAPAFYYNNHNPSKSTDPATVDVVGGVNTITVPAILVGGTIQVGLHKSGGSSTSVAWSDSIGSQGTATDFTYTPAFTADGQTSTLTAVYTDNCGTPTTYVYNLSSTTVCVPSTAPVRFYFNDNNGSGWVDPAPVTVVGGVNTITIAPIPLSGTVAVGLHLNGGDSVSYDDGLGFTATGGGDKTYSPGFTAAGETRSLTATYTDACGTISSYIFAISSTGTCTPGAPSFYYNDLSGTGWHDDGSIVLASSPNTIAPLQIGTSVTIGAHLKGGSITWNDDNGMTAVPSTSDKFEFKYNPSFTGFSQNRTLTGTYLDTCGNTTNFVYNLSSAATCIANAPGFYYSTGDGNWHDNPKALLASSPNAIAPLFYSATYSPKVTIGVELNGGSISWTDDNGMTAITNGANTGKFQFAYDPAFTNVAGGETRTLTGAYKDTCGFITNFVYTLSSTATCVFIAPIPNYAIAGKWVNNLTTASTSVNISLSIDPLTTFSVSADLQINPGTGDSNGTYSWSDSSGYVSGPSATYKTITLLSTLSAGETDDVTGIYSDKCGNATTYVFHLSSPAALGTDKFQQGAFKMYPNPADTNLNISFKGDLKISVLNISGQQVLSTRSISNQGSVDVSGLSRGIYFLKAVTNGESTVKKFIKN